MEFGAIAFLCGWLQQLCRIVPVEHGKGWFVGIYPCVNEENCFMCDCPDTDIFGGTWKAVYQKKVTTDAGAQKIAGVKFASDDDE